ncbi:MAG TPA: helix-turn-helix domain-containing protein [Steroidobacteraceae bacterium]
MTFKDIGLVLRSARKERGLSQGELAQSLGMSRATISGIENGTINEIGVRKVLVLATTLGLELSVSRRRSRPTLNELREEHRASKSRT